jgi:hypothetical protein
MSTSTIPPNVFGCLSELFPELLQNTTIAVPAHMTVTAADFLRVILSPKKHTLMK